MTHAPLRSHFAVAGASIVGPAHARTGRNNQDAWSVWLGDDLAVLAVADGCSGGAASEVGAHFAARWIVAEAARRWAREPGPSHHALAQDLFDGLVRQFDYLATALAIEPKDVTSVIAELLLTTVLVAFVDHQTASVFGCGDGFAMVDGASIALEGDERNGPPYLAYRLCDPADAPHDPARIGPRLLVEVPTANLREIVVASDGARNLVMPCQDRTRTRLQEMLADGIVARRPALLQARLDAAAREPGLLDDDVTLVALVARGHDPRGLV